MPTLEKSIPDSSRLLTPFIQWALLLLFSATFLDGGGIFQTTFVLSLVYWISIFLIYSRRAGKLTRSDRWYIAWGLLVVVLVGVPLQLAVWHLRGIFL